MSSPPSAVADNRRISKFYDWAFWLYPLVDSVCAPARRRIIQHINEHPAGRLLEIGVGPGNHLRLYRRHRITAIDCSARMVASSRNHCLETDVRQMDGEQLDFPDASYDYVTLCHVLSVTANPARMLAEIHRVLRPGGRLFVLNHETPAGAWRHVEAMISPLAGWLRFRSSFRLDEVGGVEHFRTRPLASAGAFGLIKAYSLEK